MPIDHVYDPKREDTGGKGPDVPVVPDPPEHALDKLYQTDVPFGTRDGLLGVLRSIRSAAFDSRNRMRAKGFLP